jgi:ferredoxin/flavodoxin---NADP+ reductase
MEPGDVIPDFCGPLGVASHFDGVKKAAVIGGGLGTAIAWPQAKKLFEMGAEVDIIAGFRNKDLIILEEEMNACSTAFSSQRTMAPTATKALSPIC